MSSGSFRNVICKLYVSFRFQVLANYCFVIIQKHSRGTCVWVYLKWMMFLPHTSGSSCYKGNSAGLRIRSKRVRTLVTLLRSLSDKYPWKRYDPSYPSTSGLNSTTTVLLEVWLWHWITQECSYAIKHQNQSSL